MWELWVKVYSEPIGGYSLGDNPSDSSEELFQIGKWGGQYIHDFVKGNMCSQAHILAEVSC